MDEDPKKNYETIRELEAQNMPPEVIDSIVKLKNMAVYYCSNNPNPDACWDLNCITLFKVLSLMKSTDLQSRWFFEVGQLFDIGYGGARNFIFYLIFY